MNKTVPMALEKLGYAPREIEEIVAFVDERNTVVGAPYVKTEHYPVFDCAVGDRAIHYLGHVKMMGAVQPFISGAISKTVNLPEEATVEDVMDLYVDAWKLGVKAIAIYRDNCKVAQPLSSSGKDGQTAVATPPVQVHERKRLPLDRTEVGRKFQVGDHEGYIHVGLYDDGSPGDIFVDIAKDGTTMAGLMNSLCLAVSMGLQYGVPPEVYVSKLSHMRFEPSGLTNDADIRAAKSIVDYIFRWFGKRFLTAEQQEEAGILSPEVKARLAERYANGGESAAPAEPAEAPPPGQTALFNSWEDAVECARCGGRMVRTGSLLHVPRLRHEHRLLVAGATTAEVEGAPNGAPSSLVDSRRGARGRARRRRSRGRAPANAAITASQITTPTNPSFFVADENANSQTFAISGTTSGGDPASDKVDIRCYYGGTSVKVKANVPLNQNGTFSVSGADLNKVLDAHLPAEGGSGGQGPRGPDAVLGAGRRRR